MKKDLHRCKPSIYMVAEDGIEPPKWEFSRHHRETHVFYLKQLLTARANLSN
jgi:hypothetical protein